MADRSRRTFAVVGLGTFGTTVATELARLGDEVLGVDIDEGRVNLVADRLAHAVIADARDEEALRELGLGNYDVVVVAIGEDLEANIICTVSAKLLGVPCVWAKAMTRTHHRILSRIGADRVIHPEEEIGVHVAQTLHAPVVRDYVSLGNGYHVVYMETPEDLGDRALGDLDLAGFDIHCLGLMRGTRYIACTEESRIQEEDRLLLLGKPEDLRQFGSTL